MQRRVVLLCLIVFGFVVCVGFIIYSQRARMQAQVASRAAEEAARDAIARAESAEAAKREAQQRAEQKAQRRAREEAEEAEQARQRAIELEQERLVAQRRRRRWWFVVVVGLVCMGGLCWWMWNNVVMLGNDELAQVDAQIAQTHVDEQIAQAQVAQAQVAQAQLEAQEQKRVSNPALREKTRNLFLRAFHEKRKQELKRAELEQYRQRILQQRQVQIFTEQIRKAQLVDDDTENGPSRYHEAIRTQQLQAERAAQQRQPQVQAARAAHKRRRGPTSRMAMRFKHDKSYIWKS